MAENNESFLEILNNYFSNLSEHQIVAGTKENITIPIEWVYSDKIDRDTIEQAFISLFCKANKQYRDRIKQDPEFYGKIESLEIEKSDSGVNLVIKAKDGGTKTKVVVTSEETLRGPFYGISEQQLYDAVLHSYNFQNAIEISKKLNLNIEERKRLLKEELNKPEIKEGRTALVKSEMINAAKNLVRYYDYISKINTKYKALQGTINQRKDNVPKNFMGIRGNCTKRKSEIYDFQEREDTFLEMNPIHIVNIDNIEDNTINKFAYTTFIYENPRGKDGYLFIAEPFEGIHNTRVRFVSKEEYDTLEVTEGKNKVVCLAEEMTEMSNSEFNNCKFTKNFKHTSIERYREKFRRVVFGEQVENSAEEPRYAEIDKILFDGKRRINSQTIKARVEGVSASQINSARGELYARPIIRA